MTKEKAVITGGAGFIGSHLAHKLAELGYQVVILDNLTRGKYDYIKDLVEEKKATFIQGDIRTPALVSDVLKGAKYVFHEAAVCINYSMKHAEESIDINVMGSYNVFNAAAAAGVKKLIFSSSASVYGNPLYLPMDENHPLNPITPYCASKIAGEYFLKMFGPQGLKYNIVRYFNVSGPRQSTDAFYTSVIINFMKKIQEGGAPVICGDGSQSMDFVNVHDVVEANILAAESDVNGEIFNVGSGTQTTVKELAETIIKSFKSNVKPVYQKEVKIIVQRRQAEISKIKRMLKFEPKTSLEAGLKEIAEDIVTHLNYY